MSLNYFNQGEIMNKLIQKMLPALAGIALIATFSIANAQHSEKQTKEDVQRHRAMAAAHEAAAKCLESGKKEDVCMKDLQASCKGLAVGKYCGMKHAH
jgi:hypothetical protein